MEETRVNESNGNFRPIVLIIAVGVFLLAILIIILYSYFQTKSLNTLTLSTNTANGVSSDNIEFYSNERFFYSFKCPYNSNHIIEIIDGDGFNSPFYQESCVDKENQNNKVTISIMSTNAKEITQLGKEDVKSFDTKSGTERVFIRGADKNYFDEVVSSFKFTL